MNFLTHRDNRDLNGNLAYVQNCDLNARIKKDYNLKSELEYKIFLQNNPGIVLKYMEKSVEDI